MRIGGITVLGTGRALPGKLVTNEEISRRVDTSDEWIRTRTGIGTRYECREETCTSLAAEAGRKALENAGVRPEEIGAVLVATSTGDYAFPSTACLVQQELGLPEEVMAYDLSAACTGFLMGIGTAAGLLPSLEGRKVLLIGSEEMSRVVDSMDRSTCILFGDGAGAVVLGWDPEHPVIQRSWSRGDREVLNCPGHGGTLSMKGNEVFRFAVTVLPQALECVLAEGGLTMADVDYVVCHQANERILRHVQRKYPGQEEKFYMNIARYGNTSAASIPLALDEMREAGMLKKGSRILLAGFGAGLTWSAALLTI